MRKIPGGMLPALLAGILIVSGIGCAQQAPPAATTTAPRTTQAVVQRNDVSLVVTVDGNLNMPQAFDLRFGTYGDVKEVLVEEGDKVKAGQILARLDDTIARLDVRSADNSLQKALSDLYETVPRIPQLPKKLYDADVIITPGALPANVVSTVMYFPGDTIPAAGATTITTSRSGGTGTTIYTTTTTTVGAAIPTGDPNLPGTVTVTTTVAVTNITTVTITSLVKPDSGYTWDNVNKNWTYNPDALVSPPATTGYMPRYPNYGVLIPYAWAQSEAVLASNLLSSKLYSSAVNELAVAAADLEDCIQIIQTAIDDPASGLGNWAPYVGTDIVDITSLQIQSEQADAIGNITALRGLNEELKKVQADLQKIRSLIGQRKYADAMQLFNDLPAVFSGLEPTVLANVRLVAASNDNTIYGENMCRYLYNAADARLSKAFEEVQKGGMNTIEFQNNLRIAQHEMLLCNAILGLNYDVLQHGPLLKEEQQYKMNVKNRLVTLGNKQDDFLKTVIMSPFDGIVVDVAVKKNDVLSALDYSSKGTIQVVDTTQIKFLGTVDEIDILKVKRGQEAQITVDAIPNKTFTGKVSFISPFGIKDVSNVVKFPVTILLDPSDVTLNGGLTATSRIIISSVNNVLVVPPGAVTASSGESFVNVIDPATGQLEKRKVTTGARNAQFIEITSGLAEGEKVEVEIKISGAPVTKGFPARR